MTKHILLSRVSPFWHLHCVCESSDINNCRVTFHIKNVCSCSLIKFIAQKNTFARTEGDYISLMKTRCPACPTSLVPEDSWPKGAICKVCYHYIGNISISSSLLTNPEEMLQVQHLQKTVSTWWAVPMLALVFYFHFYHFPPLLQNIHLSSSSTGIGLRADWTQYFPLSSWGTKW